MSIRWPITRYYNIYTYYTYLMKQVDAGLPDGCSCRNNERGVAHGVGGGAVDDGDGRIIRGGHDGGGRVLATRRHVHRDLERNLAANGTHNLPFLVVFQVVFGIVVVVVRLATSRHGEAVLGQYLHGSLLLLGYLLHGGLALYAPEFLAQPQLIGRIVRNNRHGNRIGHRQPVAAAAVAPAAIREIPTDRFRSAVFRTVPPAPFVPPTSLVAAFGVPAGAASVFLFGFQEPLRHFRVRFQARWRHGTVLILILRIRFIRRFGRTACRWFFRSRRPDAPVVFRFRRTVFAFRLQRL